VRNDPVAQEKVIAAYSALGAWMLIPMKVGTDSDLIPVTRSDAMAVTFGAKRRWRFNGA
jgi:hypothetical protein